ncbi:MAG: hypothetical protein QW733_07445, partial [Desulfurococcaceae archaeon]
MAVLREGISKIRRYIAFYLGSTVEYARTRFRKYYAQIALRVAFTVILLVLLTTCLRVFHSLFILTLVPPLTLQLFKLPEYLEAFEHKTRKLMLRNLPVAGRGLSTRSIRILRDVFGYAITGFVFMVFYTVVYTVLIGFNLVLVVVTLVTAILCTLLHSIPRVLTDTWKAHRKTSIEVELPYLLILYRVVASLRIPIYDILTLVENSASMPASAREVKLAKKIATLTSTSLLTAMDYVCLNNPSEKVRELFRRVFISALTMSDVRAVVERVFDEIYSWFESRVLSLNEKFTIIVGSSLVAYFFIPVVVSAVAPVIGPGVVAVLILTLSVQFLVFFQVFALIAGLFPSSLVVKTPRKLTYLGLFSISVAVALVVYNSFAYASPALQSISEDVFVPVLVAVFVPPLIIAELRMMRVKHYDMFVKASSSALLLAAATGENIVEVLERISRRYRGHVARLTRDVTLSYTSEQLRRATIQRAPTMYHATFMEILMTVLRLGSTPDMLKALAGSYEKLQTAVSTVRSFAKRLEWVFIGLVAMVGGFIAYIDRVYNYIASIVSATAPTAGLMNILVYNPEIYGLLN